VSRLACFFLLATLFVGGCREAPAPEGKPLAVASFYPMWEFTREVALDRAQVISLVPPGVAGHDWEPSPQDVAQVRRARVFVYNGAGFEPWAEKLLKEAAGPSTVVVAASAGLTVPRAGGEGGMDPHVGSILCLLSGSLRSYAPHSSAAIRRERPHTRRMQAPTLRSSVRSTPASMPASVRALAAMSSSRMPRSAT